MPRKAMTEEERAAKKAAKAEAITTKREVDKREAREEIISLASCIPPHIRAGGGAWTQFARGRNRSMQQFRPQSVREPLLSDSMPRYLRFERTLNQGAEHEH